MKVGNDTRCRSTRIAVMIGQLSGGGSERQLFMFLARCDRQLWVPTLFVSGELGIWEESIRSLGIDIVLLTGSPLAKFRTFRRLCREHKIGLFFSWSSYTNGYGLALSKMGIGRIGSFRNSSFSDLPINRRALWTWLSGAGVSAAICNSSETALTVGRRFPHLAIRYVPNGVEIPPSAAIEDFRRAWRIRLGVDEETFLVIGAGRLTPQKNFVRFVETIACLRKKVRVRAIIAGEDRGERRIIEDAVRRSGLQTCVTLIGYVRNASELLCAGDAFLLSSNYEGMPNVVLEAMSVRVPCVSTPVNGVSDLIEDGRNGFIASWHASSLASKLFELANNEQLRAMMGDNARSSVEAKFSPDKVASQLWNFCAERRVVSCVPRIGSR